MPQVLDGVPTVAWYKVLFAGEQEVPGVNVAGDKQLSPVTWENDICVNRMQTNRWRNFLAVRYMVFRIWIQ